MDFVELGIEGAENLVDKHFEKLPDAAVHRATYHPRHVKKLDPRRLSRRKRRPSSPSSSSSETAVGDDDSTPRNARFDDPYTYTRDRAGPEAPYSTLPPRTRPEYQPPLENPYAYRNSGSPSPVYAGYPPETRSKKSVQPRTYDDAYYSDSPHTRPKMVSRRSNSMGAPRRPQDSIILSGQRLKGRRRRRSYDYESDSDGGSRGGNGGRGGGGGGGGGGGEGSRKGSGRGNSGKRNGLEDKMKETFTDSNIGLGAGVLGAVVGGWAASKAQVAGGVDKVNSSKKRDQGNTFVTVLGAAAAGLAANALVDRWEDNKKKTKSHDDARYEKYGRGENNREKDKDRGRGNGSDRGGDQSRRRKSADYGRDSDRRSHRGRRDDDYLAERHGHGYEPLSDEDD